jgi:pimeloyl-ACP methyl ester carboxylesterase
VIGDVLHRHQRAVLVGGAAELREDVLAAALAPERRVLVPDLRGHGRSPPPPGPFALEDHAADVARLVETLGLARPVLLGWSLGAQVALGAAAMLGEAVGGLVLLSATPRFTSARGWAHGLPRSQVDGLAARLRIHAGKALQRFFAAFFAEGELPDEERGRALAALAAEPPDPAAALGALEALAEGDQRALVAGILVPVLLLHGGADAIVPPGAAEALAAALPRARLARWPGLGHAPFLSRPREVAALVRDFLAEAR